MKATGLNANAIWESFDHKTIEKDAENEDSKVLDKIWKQNK